MNQQVACPVCEHSTDNKGAKLLPDGKEPTNHPGMVPAKCAKCSLSSMIYSSPQGYHATLREATDATHGKTEGPAKEKTDEHKAAAPLRKTHSPKQDDK